MEIYIQKCLNIFITSRKNYLTYQKIKRPWRTPGNRTHIIFFRQSKEICIYIPKGLILNFLNLLNKFYKKSSSKKGRLWSQVSKGNKSSDNSQKYKCNYDEDNLTSEILWTRLTLLHRILNVIFPCLVMAIQSLLALLYCH